MERLTHKARYEAGYKLNKGAKEWQAVDRLGAYENTGLTPGADHGAEGAGYGESAEDM